ncbi:MAG: hypothetical protein ACRDZR_19115 [Acidimicrobiales bacterium]
MVWLGPWQYGGIYWRNGGFNWKALFSLAAGMFAALMWIDAAFYKPAYTGPLVDLRAGSS